MSGKQKTPYLQSAVGGGGGSRVDDGKKNAFKVGGEWGGGGRELTMHAINIAYHRNDAFPIQRRNMP